MRFIPIHSPTRAAPFDLTEGVLACLQAESETLQNGDILIIASKYAAVAEGRVVALSDVAPSPAAAELARQYQLDPALAELILRESDAILGGVPGFVLAVRDRLIAPNAGIDSSNIPAGHVVLYPEDPFATAERAREEIRVKTGSDVGAVICDSGLMPGRTGTTGIAIGVAGFAPVVDERGKPDLHGRILNVSQRAVADNLCSAAELLMGEAAESIPLVIARHTSIKFTNKRYSSQDLAIDHQHDIFVSILGK